MDFPIHDFINVLHNNGGEVFFVGGPVRDAILGKPFKDHDLLVRGIPQENLIRILRPLGTVNLVGKSFGVIKFKPKELPDIEFDIALPRLEKSTGVGHKEFEVQSDEKLPVEVDLARRDFTINAMAYSLLHKKIIDPFGGQEDLKNKVLRIVFPKAFEEDPLRLLRAVQFAARFNLKIEPETLESMKTHAALIKTISAERKIEEIRKLFLAPKPSVGFWIARETGLLPHVFPFMVKMIGVMQPQKNEDVFDHTLKVIDAARDSKEMMEAGNMEIMFSAMLHDAGKPQTAGYDAAKDKVTFYSHQIVSRKIARRWLTDMKATTIGLNVDQVVHLVDQHMFETRSHFGERAIRRFVGKIGPENIYRLIDLRIADKKAGRYPGTIKGVLKLRDIITEELNKKPPFGPKDLKLTGHDLIQMGYKPGPMMGKILAFLVDKVLDEPELNENEKLVEITKENFPIP